MYIDVNMIPIKREYYGILIILADVNVYRHDGSHVLFSYVVAGLKSP